MKLKEFATINMGQSPKGETYNTDGNGMPFLQGRKTFGRIYPTIDTWTSSPIKVANKDEILMSVRAPVGDMNFANQEICIGRGLCSINAKNGRNKYLYYMLLNSMNDLKQKSTGTVFDSINRNDLENLEINFHSDENQMKIENILGNIDDKIELNNEINNNLYEIASSLINEAFVNNDKIKLNEIISFVKGKKPLDISEEYKEGYEKYLTIACLNNQENMYADPTKTLLTESDILMVMDGASSGDVYFSDKGIVGSTLSKIEICNEEYIPEYVFFALKRLVKSIQEKTTGSAIPHTDKVFVGNLEIPKLDTEEQLKYKSLIAKIIENNKQNITLSNLRDTLLPKLMNGEIDLDNIEI